jgi:hypothetical protein
MLMTMIACRMTRACVGKLTTVGALFFGGAFPLSPGNPGYRKNKHYDHENADRPAPHSSPHPVSCLIHHRASVVPLGLST